MAKKPIRTFLKNPWTIGIGAPLSVYLLTSMITAIARSEGFFSSLWTVIKLRVPIWIILVLTGVGAICLAVIIGKKRSFVFEDSVYWKKLTGGAKEGPFCPRCRDSDGKLVRLQEFHNYCRW